MNKPMTRRAVLRGLGTAIALPALESLGSGFSWAAPADAAPLRLAFLYVPNGKVMADWTPSATGTGFSLPGTLQPLEKVRGKVSVLTGLTLDKARPNGDGAGDHARAQAAFLTGAQPRKTAGADIKVGVSVDQVAAQKAGDRTRLPSLELGCESGPRSGNCDSGYSCAYQFNFSWRSETTPVPKEIDPRQVFERLFGNGKDEARAARSKREQLRKSVLDFVQDDAKSLRNQLGSTDVAKLDEYLTSVRELEQRIDRAQQANAEQPKPPSEFAKPTGVPGDYQTHLRVMGDLLTLAFQMDITRIGTFVFANDGSNRSYKTQGVPDGHHDLSHHGRDQKKLDKIKAINRFHIEQLAYLLGKLDGVKEGKGTLLDNCLVVYGSGISDGDRHNHDDLPILLAGGGGGRVKPGRHLRFPQNTPLTNLYLTMLDHFGTPTTRLGDSTGKLSLS